jgi:hypothetical protein
MKANQKSFESAGHYHIVIREYPFVRYKRIPPDLIPVTEPAAGKLEAQGAYFQFMLIGTAGFA